MTDGSAIRAVGLTKAYGKLLAVDHVDMDVRVGGVFGLLGPNGAGKTTIIKLLTGLSDITAGDASVAGYDVRTEPMHVKENDRLGGGRGDPRRRLLRVGEPLAPGEAPAAVRLEGHGRRSSSSTSTSRDRKDDKVSALLHRDAQEARDRARAPPPARGDLHGRADDRPRCEHPTDALGAHHRRQQGVRRHGPAHLPLHRGGRRPLRPDLDHRPRASSSPRAPPASSSPG